MGDTLPQIQTSTQPAQVEVTEEPMPKAIERLLERRGWSRRDLAALLRAEGMTIGRSRLNQICSGTGAPASPEQMERISSVLGVSPGYFAEYRLWKTRRLLDPSVVGFERALANFGRLRGRRNIA
jgi:transcriptional regulator with XRE-family HTH domain